ADAAALAGGGVEAGEERPRRLRPARVGKGVVTRSLLVWQFVIAQFDRPLLDVQAELRERERQVVDAAEQPAKGDPVVSGEISPEHRVLVRVDELANAVADVLARHSRARELRAHGLERPVAPLGPIALAALGIEFPAVFGDQSDADQIDGVRPLDELGVHPIFHPSPRDGPGELEHVPENWTLVFRGNCDHTIGQFMRTRPRHRAYAAIGLPYALR